MNLFACTFSSFQNRENELHGNLTDTRVVIRVHRYLHKTNKSKPFLHVHILISYLTEQQMFAHVANLVFVVVVVFWGGFRQGSFSVANSGNNWKDVRQTLPNSWNRFVVAVKFWTCSKFLCDMKNCWRQINVLGNVFANLNKSWQKYICKPSPLRKVRPLISKLSPGLYS